MPIINKIPTIMKSHIDLASYLVEDTFGSVRDISKNVVAHYFVAGTTQVFTPPPPERTRIHALMLGRYQFRPTPLENPPRTRTNAMHLSPR